MILLCFCHFISYIYIYILWREEQTTDTVGVASGLGRGFYSTEIIKQSVQRGWSVQNKQGIWCPRRAARVVKEGQCSGRKGPGKGQSPAAPLGSGARGRRLPSASSSSFGPAALPGVRPGILARLPSRGWGPPLSTLPSWTHEDTSVHARGRDRSPEERRTRHITAAVMRLHSLQVCLITRRQTWLFQRPSSLTHPLPSGAWWRAAIKGRGDANN